MPGQFDEDHVLRGLLPGNFVGKMVDVGAYEPQFLSNSYAMEQRGWDVLCIEPNPNCIPKLKKERKLVLEVACGPENMENQVFSIYTMESDNSDIVPEGALTGLQAKAGDKELIKERWWQEQIHRNLIKNHKTILVPVRTLDWCLEQVKWEPPVHIVSMDTEGTEMDVLEGFDIEKWQPTLLCIENWLDDERYTKYLEPYGFVQAMVTGGLNQIYMHKERTRALHELSS